MIALLAAAQAEPWNDPDVARAQACLRAHRADTFLGDGRWAPWERAEKLTGIDPCAALVDAPEAPRDGWSPAFGLRERVGVAIGDAVPDNLGGDEEPGLFSLRFAPEIVAYEGPFFLQAEPEIGLDAAPGAAGLARMATLYGGARWRGLSVGFGRRDRWLGPGRHSALLLSDNARAPWMGTVAAEGHLPGWFDRLGRFRVEVGGGWMDQPRTDVANPGILLMDLRWLPVPELEIGATRLSLFGGEGRPAVDVGQLLLPTEPHVSDDPDRLLPDQDELASIDVRLTLPVGTWLGIPVDAIEGWWQYGGEDVIGRKLGPIPYPSLAGVGNLYGGAVHIKGFAATVEYTALLDDYFRWYVGHRVYHEGFTQDGRTLGQFAGTDAETLFLSAAWQDDRVRARLWGDTVRRVGVIEALNDRIFTLSTEEHRQRVGVDGGLRVEPIGWVLVGYTYEHLSGADFVPGAEVSRHRVTIGIERGFTLSARPGSVSAGGATGAR